MTVRLGKNKDQTMPRLAKLEDVLFPVDEHPVFVSFTDPNGERRLPVPEKKAIVNRNNQRVLGIVSRDYRLVSNQEALNLAYRCCEKVFPETKSGEWEVKTTDAPATAGYCHLDLVHNSTALDFRAVPAAERPEMFGPFIRVTNSYNGLRALAFDVGFYRKVCKNGMIIPDTIIRFRFTHSPRDIGKSIEFNVAHDQLAKFKNSFSTFIGALQDCKVGRAAFEPFICGVLLLRRPEAAKPDSHEAAHWQTLNNQIGEMSDRYAGELGENAYAVFNAVTEFASHPPVNRCVHRDRHGLQRLAGSWLNTFSHQCRQPEFALPKYLRDLPNLKPETEARRDQRGNGHGNFVG